MTLRLVVRPGARDDLLDLYDHLAERSGPEAALGYIARIEAFCLGLRDLPRRGTPRDDLAPGLRTLAFERRAVVAYRVRGGELIIMAVVHRGRRLTPGLARR